MQALTHPIVANITITGPPRPVKAGGMTPKNVAWKSALGRRCSSGGSHTELDQGRPYLVKRDSNSMMETERVGSRGDPPPRLSSRKVPN